MRHAYRPVPEGGEETLDAAQAELPAQHGQGTQLLMGGGVGRGEGRDVDGVADGLVAGRVDHVAQSLLGVLDAPTFRVAVAEVDELLLLARPQTAHTLPVHLVSVTGQVNYVYHGWEGGGEGAMPL